MKKILNAPACIILLAIAILFASSCQKEVSTAESSSTHLLVYLNDDPSVNFAKVLVDIRTVEVKIDTASGRHEEDDEDDHHGNNHDEDDDDDDDQHGFDEHGQWDTLNVVPGLYDLLRLRNGVDTLLGQGQILNGTIKKIRITIGNGSRVFTDSVTSAPLNTCNHKPYLYVKVKKSHIDTLAGGQQRINIDFDVSRSIKIRNGQFCLQPYLKSYGHHSTGKIEGSVFPYAARPLVKVYNATDTAFAIPWRDGEYKVSGLRAGIYSVMFDATASTYRDTTISNIQVYQGRETHVPSVTLRP